MSAARRPTLVDSRRKFWWGEHELIDCGVPARIGTSAWTVYTCLLRHVNSESLTFPSVKLLMAETGLSNRVIAASVAMLKAVQLIDVDRESHQWNVYRILDVMQAIKKNAWVPVKVEADDEKSPAWTGSRGARKHVTKRHLPRDERSPEQVTKSHTKKNQLKTTIEEGGVRDVIGEDSAATQPATPLVDTLSEAPHTTGEASLSTEVETVREPAPEVAALSPDGEATDTAITDTDLAFLFGHAPGQQTAEQIDSGEDTPAAGGTALAGLQVTRVDDLTPIPQDELRARPGAAPADPAYKTIKGLVGGNRAIDDGLLDTLTPSGALPRRGWLHLTDAELADVRRIAQAEAQREQLNFYTVAIRGLDRLIGAPVRQTNRRGRVETVALPGAYLTMKEKAQQAAQLPAVGSEETWYSRRTGKAYRIGEVTSQSVFVEEVGEYPFRKFHDLFIREACA